MEVYLDLLILLNFLVDLLLTLIEGFLMPMVYLYIGVLTASCCMPENRLGTIAEGLKKALTWVLTTSLLAFTIYLSVVKVISGAADGTSVKLTKAAISGVVPVVGGILSDAADAVLLSAATLGSGAGIWGILTVLAVFLAPALRIGVQYLLLKLTAAAGEALGCGRCAAVVGDFAGVLGLLMALCWTQAVMLLITSVCFLKGMGP